MSIGHLQNEMRKQALLAMKGQATPRLGLVSSFDPSVYAAKVKIQPENTETGWLPVMTPWLGNGWGLHSPPTNGDQVLVLFQEAHPEAGLVIGGFFSDADRPLSVTAGELWIVHQSGASVKLTNDGALTLTNGGASIALTNGAIHSSGPWTHTGMLTASGDVKAGTVSLEHHIHSGVASGSGVSGAPVA